MCDAHFLENSYINIYLFLYYLFIINKKLCFLLIISLYQLFWYYLCSIYDFMRD